MIMVGVSEDIRSGACGRRGSRGDARSGASGRGGASAGEESEEKIYGGEWDVINGGQQQNSQMCHMRNWNS